MTPEVVIGIVIFFCVLTGSIFIFAYFVVVRPKGNAKREIVKQVEEKREEGPSLDEPYLEVKKTKSNIRYYDLLRAIEKAEEYKYLGQPNGDLWHDPGRLMAQLDLTTIEAIILEEDYNGIDGYLLYTTTDEYLQNMHIDYLKRKHLEKFTPEDVKEDTKKKDILDYDDKVPPKYLY